MKGQNLDYHENSRQYYGDVLEQSSDLKTSACCPAKAPPNWLKNAYARLPDEILAKFYGCGSPLPLDLEGTTVLDLGCGTGRDVFTAAQFVGPNGKVIGVDLLDSQLDVAKRYAPQLTKEFDLPESAIRFAKGPLENLAAFDIEDESVDIVISNCVLNLCPDKSKVLAEIIRVLKPGGELYFSDVFANRRLSTELREDPIFHGECLGGAWYWEDFRRHLAGLNIPDYRIMSRSPLDIEDEEMARRSDGVQFESVTIRAFKLDSLEDRCEDYGQTVIYGGSVPSAPRIFELDPSHRFEKGRPDRVCGNSAAMIQETRFAKHFKVVGDRNEHFGLFDCAPQSSEQSESGSCC
ncbi:methyltransferase domain-containing protein [Puniceicoccaceae bacterium K14]|nr:methyltransferase domain-containing protein [Puniceicoccaceae bacterium K14]